MGDYSYLFFQEETDERNEEFNLEYNPYRREEENQLSSYPLGWKSIINQIANFIKDDYYDEINEFYNLIQKRVGEDDVKLIFQNALFLKLNIKTCFFYLSNYDEKNTLEVKDRDNLKKWIFRIQNEEQKNESFRNFMQLELNTFLQKEDNDIMLDFGMS